MRTGCKWNKITGENQIEKIKTELAEIADPDTRVMNCSMNFILMNQLILLRFCFMH